MTDGDQTLREFALKLGHAFDDLARLRHALTHRSFANERRADEVRDNERLEFLGDAVLGAAASTMLYHQFPEATEGELTRRRADLVCEASLAAIARELDLGTAMRLGKGEIGTGGRDKPRLLASALEACLGAVCIDGGTEAAVVVARGLLEHRTLQMVPGAHDHKSKLQELAQAHRLPLPLYRLARADGPDHQRTFHVVIEIDGEQFGDGVGSSKLEAEQAAASMAVPRLRDRASALLAVALADSDAATTAATDATAADEAAGQAAASGAGSSEDDA